MSFIILNGRKSTTVKGLLIQSLPPISKPLMRTSVEEIDGRDGDVITKLGYSAYDKQMSIGLFGDFDIDEVIEYFNSEGSVIFSNELDKYYYYKIIAQIDYEKLLRFRTATVTFHVQPFKYSAVDNTFSFYKNQLRCKVFSASQSGISLNSQDGVVTLSGTAASSVEFYVPINKMELSAGSYTLLATSDGTGESSVKIRVINAVPSNADSFGGQALTLENDGSAEMTASLTAQKTYNYVWIRISSGATVNFSVYIEMLANDVHSFEIFNRGNVVSRPKFTIYGSGNINLSINGAERFVIALGMEKYITIDGAGMNAYKGDVLKNRLVTGDYNNLTLNTGRNAISWTGNITQIEVEDVSRWI